MRKEATPFPDRTKALRLAAEDGVELELWAVEEMLPKAPEDWDDSDDETDDYVRKVRKPEICDTAQEGLDFEYRQITVTETAYLTYRAVMLYLVTGHIEFLPLASSLAPLEPLPKKSRQDFLRGFDAKYPTLPLPVSPKSVYRLAHLLQLDELQQIALDKFASSLTVNGAATELFSPVSIAYDELRKAAIEFAVKNWKAVQATDTWTELQARAVRGEVPQSSLVHAELLAAVSAAI
ncbi:hypothetical protein JCM3774_000115 [Rhodotorula dairenensis]